MSIKLNLEIHNSFSKGPSVVFSSAKWICAVLWKADYAKGTFGSHVFGRHLLNLKTNKKTN